MQAGSMMTMLGTGSGQHEDHARYMRVAMAEARRSPPKPTNFCVGACLVADGKVLVTGYTLECEGNTHAEQCCFIKLARIENCNVADVGSKLPVRTVLYTTMEPCNKRSVGNDPCVDRILSLRRADDSCAIETVYVGVTEPETFVGVNQGMARLKAAGVNVQHVPGFEEEILRIATAGHQST